MKRKGKVFVGLSGGVDSSVSAALLKEAGYEVTGVFIKVWQPDWITCTWKEDRLDAMRVCAKLDIPFVTLDLVKEYKREVVDYMIDEYKAGRTPNPDVMCNKYVKFGAFFDWAMAQGADYVATGHYARTAPLPDRGSPSPGPKSETPLRDMPLTSTALLAALDPNKDQSYFLWTLTQKQLAHTLFPIGHLEKPQVRKLAEKYGLITADKKDSQGLCFIGKVDMKDFLRAFLETKKGDVLDEAGNGIGEHEGAVFLTIGERHGFTITKKTANDAPYYVIAKDIEKNTITVSHKDPRGMLSDQRKDILLQKTNWITPIEEGKTYLVRARYRAELVPCKLAITSATECRVVFGEPQSTLTAGQSLVVYDGKECKGGGIIVL